MLVYNNTATVASTFKHFCPLPYQMKLSITLTLGKLQTSTVAFSRNLPFYLRSYISIFMASLQWLSRPTL